MHNQRSITADRFHNQREISSSSSACPWQLTSPRHWGIEQPPILIRFSIALLSASWLISVSKIPPHFSREMATFPCRNLYSCLLLVILFSPCIRNFNRCAERSQSGFLAWLTCFLRFARDNDRRLIFFSFQRWRFITCVLLLDIRGVFFAAAVNRLHVVRPSSWF